MAIKTATPYLILNGRAQEAIEFYQKALGAKVDTLQRFGEMMENCPEAMKEWVAHARLQLDETVLLMSDGGPGEKQEGSAVQVAIHFDDEAQARASFDALAEGGTVTEALFNAPWGGLFGALRDRFGIAWMFTTPH